MPVLDWIGKKAVVNHHRDVPYRLLHCDKSKSVGDPDSGNLIVQGDNLEALKALLPYYGGKVNCIYIDPPYNTGNEGWAYNDNSNSPEVLSWLGRVVGKEAEDLSRHDKWLCMMYPRLRLLKEFLSENGCIAISIDDVEVANLRLICDEIFGKRNFIATICWQKIYTVKNSAKHISGMHDYIVIYAKNKNLWSRNLRPRDAETDENYSNPDNDPRDEWISHALQSRNFYSKGTYAIRCPGGRIIDGPPDGTYWRVEEKKFRELDADKRIWWGLDGNNAPRVKEFLNEAKDGVVPVSWWTYKFAGTNSGAKTHLRELLGGEAFFDTPKPVELIERILDLATDKNSIIMDAFAGSGTTGHAVLKRNIADNGSRKFILIETIAEVANNVTSPRVGKAVTGYQSRRKEEFSIREYPLSLSSLRNGASISSEIDIAIGEAKSSFSRVFTETRENRLCVIGEREKTEFVQGLGGGFRFCNLGSPLFDPDGGVSAEVSFADLAAHVFFCDTGSPIPRKVPERTSLIGTFQDRAIYLLFSSSSVGVPLDKAGNVLTAAVLKALPLPEPGFSGARVVYGEGCTVPDDRLAAAGITFRQVPYQIEGI